VSISGAAPETSIVVLVSPTVSFMEPKLLSRPAATRILLCTEVLNPWAETSTLYSPAGIRLNRKKPALSDVEVRVTPVEVLAAFTCAPETTAPCGSRTVPEIDPFSTWPTDGMHQTTTRQAATSIKTVRSLRFILCISILDLCKKRQWRARSSPQKPDNYSANRIPPPLFFTFFNLGQVLFS